MKKTLLLLVAVVFAVTACDKATYVDGEYHATFSELDSHDWNAFVSFTLTEDVVTDVDFDYLDADGNRKTEDAGYQVSMLAYAFVIVDGDTIRTNPETYAPIIEANIALAEIDPFAGIDAVSGATSSTENADILIEAILDAAVDGEETDIIVPQPHPAEEE
jgi:major membrane immunogen (membrane-anchored lipoprotein)